MQKLPLTFNLQLLWLYSFFSIFPFQPQEVVKEQEEPKKEIFIIKHRKSHDEKREKNNIKITPFIVH